MKAKNKAFYCAGIIDQMINATEKESHEILEKDSFKDFCCDIASQNEVFGNIVADIGLEKVYKAWSRIGYCL